MTVSHDPKLVSHHYDKQDLGQTILEGLRAVGKDLDRLIPEDLNPVDQFHMGGREATLQLIQLANLPPGAKVLDAGGGLGGPARTLAAQLHCHVTVLDLSESYCQTGAELTELTGMSDKVSFEHADALNMPFDDGKFDAVWTQHSSMNIAGKEALYAEIHRVLRPGGRLAIHEVMAGPNSPVLFPVPWAREPEISFVRRPNEIRALLSASGFNEVVWFDLTPAAIAFWRKRLAAPPPVAQPIGLHLLFGSEWDTMAANTSRNLEEGRIEVIQAVFDRI